MSIRPVSTTMGVSSPASVGGGKYYRYNGDQPYRPPPPSDPLPQNVKASTARQRRLTRYCELRAAGKTRTEAAAAIPVCDSTSKAYEAEFQDRQRREGLDA